MEIRHLKDITKDIRAELKTRFPECKFSVRVNRGIAIAVSLMTAPVTPFASLVTVNGYEHDGEYAQLNHYHIRQDAYKENWISNGYYLTEDTVKMLNEVIEISGSHGYVRFFHLEIGQWDKPFAIK